jgi:hypothetical protein
MTKRCRRCAKTMTWAATRVQFGRALRAGLTPEAVRDVMPACQKCMTVALRTVRDLVRDGPRSVRDRDEPFSLWRSAVVRAVRDQTQVTHYEAQKTGVMYVHSVRPSGPRTTADHLTGTTHSQRDRKDHR